MMSACRRAVLAVGVLLTCELNSCVHYRARPLEPVQAESAYQSRSFRDGGLAAFVHSVRDAPAEWPPQTLTLASASLVAAYFNPSLNVARAQVRTAEAAMVSAGARPNPAVSGAGGYETLPESPVVVRFELSLPIETARKRSYRILEAAKLADAARIELNEASWRVYSQVRDAWRDYLTSGDEAWALRSEAQARTDLASAIYKRVSAGEAGRPDWETARIEESRTAVALAAANGRLAETSVRLAEAMGLPTSALQEVRIVSDGETPSPQPLEALPIARVQQRGLLNRLDIQRSLLEYAATEARLQLEVARQYPDIQLNPGYDFDEGYHKFTFGPTLPVPVWNRNRGAIGEAEARRAEAEARFLVLQAQAIGEIERSLAGYRSAFAAFQEADQRWSSVQAGRERATVRAVQLGEEDRLSLTQMRLESAGALQARLDALAKSRIAFSALEDAVQAPLDHVRWIRPGDSVNRKQEK